jgi:hypothetical protein
MISVWCIVWNKKVKSCKFSGCCGSDRSGRELPVDTLRLGGRRPGHRGQSRRHSGRGQSGRSQVTKVGSNENEPWLSPFSFIIRTPLHRFKVTLNILLSTSIRFKPTAFSASSQAAFKLGTLNRLDVFIHVHIFAKILENDAYQVANNNIAVCLRVGPGIEGKT